MEKFDGIAVAGNILTDNVKMVESYPEKGMLATILTESLAVGGCVPNTGIDLKRLDKNLTVKAFGRVGNDDKGRYVLGRMKEEGLDIDEVKVCDSAPTSYSDVITVKTTGERTFFHNRGANALFNLSDVNISAINQKIFHMGYLMLLDSFDKLSSDGSTSMGVLLKSVREKGVKTSIDIVSESSGNFIKVARAALPFCDYVIINEIEAGAIAGINVRNGDGSLSDDNVKSAMYAIAEAGVNEKVVVHCPEKGFSLDKSGKFTTSLSRKLKKGFIKGSVGAGDAFCAGSLYALYKGYSDEKMLDFANLVAVNCLAAPDSVSGVVAIEKLNNVFSF